jgi:hypothetical protein
VTIRTPDDEPEDKPGTFYPPFHEGWTYQGATYAGHSDFATDWNRRTPSGGWLDDRGDPVLAAADGTVAEVTPVDGYVAIDHYGGTWRTEYRHMQPVRVKVGDKVKRGDRIGDIGEAGNAPNGTHLHHRQYHRDKPGQAWKAVKMRFDGKPIGPSVGDSDTRPEGWTPPPTEMVVGPAPKVTWESAYREAAKLLDKADDRVASAQGQTRAITEERDLAHRDLATASATIVAQGQRIAELEAMTPPDCSAAVVTERTRVLEALSAGVDLLVTSLR